MIDLHALPPIVAGPRADRVRAAMGTVGVDALVVSDLRNVRWLTGFSGSAATVVLTPERLVLVTDGRYGEQAVDEAAGVRADVEVVVGRTLSVQRDQLSEVVRPFLRIGLESGNVTWARQRELAAAFGVDLIATDGLVESLRAIKDPAEVARIEAAAAIADSAFAAVAARFGEGLTEHDVAIELDLAMRRLGASGPSFETIVAAGPNSAFPHHRPNRRRIVEADLVVCDFGALVDGYASDMTRTVVVGDPSAEQRDLWDLVRAAQQAGADRVGPGVATSDVDAACREVIATAGLGERFTHGTGHGVGLAIHESPWIGATSTGALAAGNVVTVEPGVYVPGLGGVRIEDTLLVTEHGARPLTHTPKDLRCPQSPPTT